MSNVFSETKENPIRTLGHSLLLPILPASAQDHRFPEMTWNLGMPFEGKGHGGGGVAKTPC